MSRARVLSAVALLLVAGCARPDLGEQIADLERRLRDLPGVTDIDVYYSNDMTQGYRFDVDLDVRDASPPQIVTIADTFHSFTGGDFDRYDRSVTFVLDRGVTVEQQGPFDPGSATADIADIDVLAQEIPGARIHWSHPALRIDEVSVTDALDAARTTLSDRSPTITVLPGDGTIWTVTMPLTPPRQAAIRDAVDSVGIPVSAVEVTDGRATGLTVRPTPGAAAEDELRAVIDAFDAGIDRPLMVTWTDERRAGNRDGDKFAGRIHVGGCDYPDDLGERDPERFFTSDALDLRDRLRDEFDTCETPG